MIITLFGYKGGVGKTTSSVHLAAFMAQHAPTVLVDGDFNRSATLWARRDTLPFPVIPESAIAKHAAKYTHIVIDTAARPSGDELLELAESTDLLILPTNPELMSLDAVLQTSEGLRQVAAAHYRILLTQVPPKPSLDGEAARAQFQELEIPLFQGEIRRSSAFARASELGVPVYGVKNNRAAKSAWMDYEAIGREILALQAER